MVAVRVHCSIFNSLILLSWAKIEVSIFQGRAKQLATSSNNELYSWLSKVWKREKKNESRNNEMQSIKLIKQYFDILKITLSE